MDRVQHAAFAAIAILTVVACDSKSASMSGIAAPRPDAGTSTHCTTTRDCASSDAPRVCAPDTQRCVDVTTEDCPDVTGPWDDADAVWIGALISKSPAQLATDTARGHAAALAVERINESGGIYVRSNLAAPERRKLVLITCDESVSLLRAGEHLIRDLGIAGVIGPSTSQDVLDLARRLSIEAGAVLIAPTAMATDIAHLIDRDLVWQMVPTTEQRAPRLVSGIEALANDLALARHGAGVKVAIAYRDDALGVGLRNALSQLTLNGKPLADPDNLGARVRIDAYDPARSDQGSLVAAYATFRPDIVVLAGEAEAVTDILAPLEHAWDEALASRPHYVLTDGSKTPELVEAARSQADLRPRVHGVGSAAAGPASAVSDAVTLAYEAQFPNASFEISGVGSTYDATVALALALSAAGEARPTGEAIARGLRALALGSRTVRTDEIDAALSAAAERDALALGTHGALSWDDNGAVREATLSAWCIEGEPATLQSSGELFDVASGLVSVEPQHCSQSLVGATRPATGTRSPAVGAPPRAASTPDVDPADDAGTPDAGAPEDAATPPAVGPRGADLPSIVTAARRDNDWGDGYCDTVTVGNTTAMDVQWRVELQIEGTIRNFWNCVAIGRSGSVRFRGVDYNRTLASLQSTSFGYCADR